MNKQAILGEMYGSLKHWGMPKLKIEGVLDRLAQILTTHEGEPSPQELYLQKAEDVAARVEPTVCPNCGSDEWITVCDGCYHPLDKEGE